MSVDSWLSAMSAPAAIDGDLLVELRGDLDAAVGPAVAGVRSQLGGDALPIRMPKGRLADLQRCERTAVARWSRPDEMSSDTATLRGAALDHFIAHQLVAGQILEPIADLESMFSAAGEDEQLESLRSLGQGEATELLDPLAASVRSSWAGIDPGWEPRVQSRASLSLAEGDCRCTGIIDVELGGARTGLPKVIVEVKSGRNAASHLDEVYLYALLVALRDGSAPAVVARWYPGSDPTEVQVTLGVLEAAARRLADGVRRWCELLLDEPPVERGGGWCSWCPDQLVCESSQAGPGDGADT